MNLAIGTAGTIAIVLLVIMLIALAVLVVVGKKAQKRQEENEKAIAEAAQDMKLYIIDKKKGKITDANLPKGIMESIPKMAKLSKMPLVKAKVGPKIVTFICDAKVFETLLPKQEVMATVSGLYITKARRLKGPVYQKEDKKKKGLFGRKK